MLDASSPIPLYQQLADEIAQRIRTGELTVGARLDGEYDLAAKYQIGRPTVRQATEVLVRRGLLERRRGSGTYVTEPRPSVDLFTLAGTLKAFAESGERFTTELIVKPRVRAVHGEVEPPFVGEDAVTFVRVGCLEGRPVLVEKFYLAPAIFGDLSAALLEGKSLSALVEQRYGRRPNGGRQVLRVGCAEGRVARALEVSDRTPLLVVRRFIDLDGAPSAVFVRMYCRTDRVELVQSLGNEPGRTE